MALEIYEERPEPDYRKANRRVLIRCQFCEALVETWLNGVTMVVCDGCIQSDQLQAIGLCLFAVLTGCAKIAGENPAGLCRDCLSTLAPYVQKTVVPKGAQAVLEYMRALTGSSKWARQGTWRRR